MRNEYGVLGGFEETGREEVKKDVSKIATKAEKPDFFMGGCGPTVPTGPKRKLRNSWMNKSSEDSEAPPRVEHVPKPLKKWTPVKKKALPPRSKTHDGSVNPLAVRGGKKKADKKKEEEEPQKKEEEKAPQEKRSVSPLRSSAPERSAPSAEDLAKPATPPPKAAAPKESPKPKEEEEKPAEPAAAVPAPASEGDTKDAEIAALKAEIEKLKTEKGALARGLKKSKGAAGMNKELKEEIFELKQELKKCGTHAKDENAKGFHKLENKLNTLKMILDGKVDKNNLEELQDHVSMVNMILNQDLKKEGMKNIWA